MMRLGTTTPRLTDKYMETVIYGQQRTDELRRPDRRPTLHEPAGGDVREDGAYAGHVACSSLYSALVLHRERALTAAATGLGLLLARRLGAARFR